MAGNKTGDEKLLLPDLINAVWWASNPPESRGPIQPVNDCWETKHDVDAIAKGGSGNIPKMREAIRYLRDPAKYDSEATWLRLLNDEHDNLGFMAFEAFSSIYGNWHLYSHLAVFREARLRGDQDLAQLSAEWLQLYFLGNAFAYVRGQRVTCPGMRSVGHMASFGLREYSIELALTEPGQAVALPTPPAKIAPFLLKGDERHLLDLFRPQIQEVAAPVRKAFPDPDQLAGCHVPGWTIQVPFHFLRAPDGIAAWAERNCNANTAPVLAGAQFSADPNALWLPPGGGTRFRRWDDAHCQRQGDLLVYTSLLFGAHQQAIPGHGVVEYVWQGKSFAKADGSSPGANPGAPVENPPAPPPERRSIADGIAALQLSQTQRALQNRIVQELRTDPLDRPPAVIADDVASFGIGAGQEQAVLWKKLIAELRTPGPA
jgi:hypothetical protein